MKNIEFHNYLSVALGISHNYNSHRSRGVKSDAFPDLIALLQKASDSVINQPPTDFFIGRGQGADRAADSLLLRTYLYRTGSLLAGW